MSVPDLQPDEDEQDGIFLPELEINEEGPPDDDNDDDDDEEEEEEEEVRDDSVYTFTGHTSEIYAVACSPADPALVATGGADNRVFLWKIGHAGWASELQGITGVILSLAFNSDGQLLVSGAGDGLVKVWDVSGNLKCTLEGPGGGILWVKWHPKRHLILAGSEDCTVWMWNADNGNCLNIFSGHGDRVTCGDFTPDGKAICTVSEDRTLRIWNPKSGESIQVLRGRPYHTLPLTRLSISNDSTFAVTGAVDGSVHIVNIRTGKVVSSWTHQISSTREDIPSIECVSFAPNFPWAVSGGMHGDLTIWDLQHSFPRFICNHPEGVTCLAWLGASKFLATGCEDGRIRVWDCLSGECVETFQGHQDGIISLSVSSNFEFLVSVSWDHTGRVFDIRKFHWQT